MSRYWILFFVFILFADCTFASGGITADYYNPYRKVYYDSPHYRHYPRRNFYSPNIAELNSLERYALNKNYLGDSNLNRLQRLEKMTFGAIQQGDFDSRYDRVRAAILSRPKAQKRKTLRNNINDYFSGQLTGFTPQINNYAYSDFHYVPSNYGNSSMTDYSSLFGKHGTMLNNYGTTTGSRITILD